MSIEFSHGKARTVSPRIREIDSLPAADKPPPVPRDNRGRFGAGNKAARRSSEIVAIKRLLGDKAAADPVVAQLAKDSARFYGGALDAMPADTVPVRSMLALYGSHLAIAGYYSARAADVGLDSPRGIEFANEAIKHGQRAEKCLVAAAGLASKTAKKPAGDDAPPWIDVPADDGGE